MSSSCMAASTTSYNMLPKGPVSASAPCSASVVEEHHHRGELGGAQRLAQYTIVRRLRETLYGETTLCRDSTTDQLVVLKRMNLRALQENRVGGHENPLAERRVIHLLHRQRPHSGTQNGHAHIVQYCHSSHKSAMFVARGDLYTAMEFCEDGDLFDYVDQQQQKQQHSGIAQQEALRFIHQIASALAFLHSHGIAHRDLSLENVLLCHDKQTAKLCDFGLSCDATTKHNAVVGKAAYMAPEVARGDWYDAAQADMWSLGVVLFTLLTGAPLIADHNVRDKILRVVAKFGVAKVLELWGMKQRVSSGTLALLDELLQVQPHRRPTAAQVLRHPVFWAINQPTS